MTPLNRSGVPRIGFFQSVFVEWCDPDSGEESVTSRIPKVELEDKGTGWTDFIGEARGHLAFLVSGRAVAGLRAAGIESFDLTPTDITRIPKKLRDQERDDYFVFSPRLIVSGQIERLGHVDRFNVAEHRRILINGSESFQGPIARFEDSPTIVCTWGVVELARAEKWTNIGFHPVDAIKSVPTALPPNGSGLITIDPLSRGWPPERFYSEHHESVIASHQTQMAQQAGAGNRLKPGPHL